jgi:hypothetical protein
VLTLDQHLPIVLLLVLDLLLFLNELLPQVSLLPVQVEKYLHVLVQLHLLLILDDLGDLADLARVLPPRLEDPLLMSEHLMLLSVFLVLEVLDRSVQQLGPPLLKQVVGLIVEFLGFEGRELKVIGTVKLPVKFLVEGEEVLGKGEALGGRALGRVQGKCLEGHGPCRVVPGHPMIFF